MSLDDQSTLQLVGSQRRIKPFSLLTAHDTSDADASSESATHFRACHHIIHTSDLCTWQCATTDQPACASVSHGRWSALVPDSSYDDDDSGSADTASMPECCRIIDVPSSGLYFLIRMILYQYTVHGGGSSAVEDLIYKSNNNGRKDSAHAIVDSSSAAAFGTPFLLAPTYWLANAPGINKRATGKNSGKKLSAKHRHLICGIDPPTEFLEPGDKQVFAADAPPASTSANGVVAESNRTLAPALTMRSDEFIVDSGASCHATGYMDLLADFTPAPQTGRSVCVANGSQLPILGHGSVCLQRSVTLPGVLYVPGLAKNIVSVSRLGELDYSVTFSRTRCFIREACDGAVVGEGRRVNGLFQLEYLRVPLGRSRCAACVRLGSE